MRTVEVRDPMVGLVTWQLPFALDQALGAALMKLPPEEAQATLDMVNHSLEGFILKKLERITMTAEALPKGRSGHAKSLIKFCRQLHIDTV